MALKKTGLSRELIVHPGETVADVLEERKMSQAELAVRTGVTPAYVSNVIAGKKDISASFALSLEYALGVPASVWLKLQANYDAELALYEEKNTITDEEIRVRERLAEVNKFLRDGELIPKNESVKDNIISLRRFFGVSNLVNMASFNVPGAFRVAKSDELDPYVLSAWLLINPVGSETGSMPEFDPSRASELTRDLKKIMNIGGTIELQKLRACFRSFGIDFHVTGYFRGAPVRGFVSRLSGQRYRMVVTAKNGYAEVFWFSIFHELWHIINGEIGKEGKTVFDLTGDLPVEPGADIFAEKMLMDPQEYKAFSGNGGFTADSIIAFSNSQGIPPCIVTGRLTRDGFISLNDFPGLRCFYRFTKDKMVPIH